MPVFHVKTALFWKISLSLYGIRAAEFREARYGDCINISSSVMVSAGKMSMFKSDSIHKNGLQPQGLYDPALDHDSCGVGFVVDIHGRKTRKIVDMGIQAMCNIEHRGGLGADPETGDGAGILIQMPDKFFRKVTAQIDIQLPAAGRYGVGNMFLPNDKVKRSRIQHLIEKVIMDESQNFLGWREIPVDREVPGEGARQTMPTFYQCFIGAGEDIKDDDDFERRLYLIRRIIDRRVRNEEKCDRKEYYVPSFSSRTINYKGMLLGEQMTKFFLDLGDPDMESALALIHTRFSTNTLPTWDLAHPYRTIAHNGEINTVRGNMNWMAARQMVMNSEIYGQDLKRMLPIIMEGQSDSATFDTVLELLVMSGRSLPHAVMMMIPEAWSKNDMLDDDLRAFYEFHAMKMEPWDGPAAVAFTDGRVIGATLDRNGLRPARYVVTKDGLVIMASEVGVIKVAPENIEKSGRLQPGKMFLIDLGQGRIIDDSELKRGMVAMQPYKEWVEDHTIRLNKLPDPPFVHRPDHDTIVERQRAFGYTQEELIHHLRPMAVTGAEAVGSMGVDAAVSVLSERPQPLFRYFKQNFAQVTNPPVDAIREELVFELTSYIGPEGNLLSEKPGHARRLELEHPVLTNHDLEKIRNINESELRSITINILFDPDTKHGMRIRLDQICEEAADNVRAGKNLIILSDRGTASNMAAIPSLLAVSAVHHFLIKAGLRTKCGLIIESGEPREVAHFCTLIGYGANAINPYLAFETLWDMHREGLIPEVKSESEARKNYVKAVGKGLFKTFSKMGISTLQSYCGAQIFEVVGLDSELVNNYFTGTRTLVEGLSLEIVEEEALRRHRLAYDHTEHPGKLDPGGVHFYRKTGEYHLLNPRTIYLLQQSTRTNNYEMFKEFTKEIDEQRDHRATLRGIFQLDTSQREPVPIDEVEPATEIVKRFQTGAMSFGSISWEAHTTLAIAMNRIGAKSNTGEGGEDKIRYKPLENGDLMRSSIKQVASGRFGVTTDYLVNADDLQIKMAQGAKPGEGGQLPGHKVDDYIAKLRFSTPGVSLISPPPHHDIYSIEDLKQLIFDLKNVNPTSRVSVKLVSESGVGTVAAGVAKCHADHILISGHEGGTGASPLSSIHYAGTPWELGLSETQQALVVNGLRDRVFVGVDGKMMTGRDVVIGALLGADEFGFSTTALIVTGCIMLRKCHLNTCSVGVATQDPDLRKNFRGDPTHVVNFMLFLAEEVREHMAAMGFRKMDDMIGQVQYLKEEVPRDHWKARSLDFSRVLTKPEPAFETDLYRTKDQDHKLYEQIDNQLIEQAKPALESKTPVKIDMEVKNVNRSVGAMLGGEIARRYGEEGLPDGSIEINMQGLAGQSFGAFVTRGVTINLSGQANDYCGKGLSGGRIIVRVPESGTYEPTSNIIIGNTCFYGATSGEAFINGVAGERFCVRNSGVRAVVEGVGDHGCEYMTGGRVVVLGSTGRNFAAGMSGGIAYIWDPEKVFEKMVNPAMVELDPLSESQEIDDVLHMITRHKEYTGSPRAAEILANWDQEIGRFVKVIPAEYKLALQRREEDKESELETEVKIGMRK